MRLLLIFFVKCIGWGVMHDNYVFASVLSLCGLES